MSGVLVVGEALVDIVHTADGEVRESPGGSPANVALALGRLGRSPRLHTRLGDDERGRVVRSWLENAGVEVDQVTSPRTATAVARLDSEGAAEYEFDLEWALAEASIAPPTLLHTGSIAALLAPGADDVRRLVEGARATALITYDPNIRPSLLPDRGDARDRVERMVADADIVKASDEDLAWLYPDRDASTTARTWLATGPELVVVTNGESGSHAFAAGGEARVPAVRTSVVDTVGAGDTFMAALIDQALLLVDGSADPRARLRAVGADDIERMLRVAAHAAAITVSRPGAEPPSRIDLDASLLNDSKD